jgi:hypothetical protein
MKELVPAAVLVSAFAIFSLIQYSSETRYQYRVAYETCGGLQDTVEVIGYQSGLSIYNQKRAVPELVVCGGKAHNGFPVAYNVCHFTIISKEEIK